MKPTPLGRTVVILAIALLSIGFVIGSVAPAIAAIVLLAYRDATRRGIDPGTITAKRHVPAVVAADKPFSMELEATSEVPLPLAIEDPDDRIEVVESHEVLGRGEASLVRQVQAPTPGTLRWSDVTVLASDAWGLWQRPHRVPAPASLKVAPPENYLQEGRRAGQRNVIQAAVKDPQASMRGVDVRMVRPFMPGDQARNIDWRISTRLGELHSRHHDPEGPRRVIIFMDATRSMRRPARIPKLRSASNVATAIAGAAHGAGVSASLVAFHEHGVHTVANATSQSGLQDIVRGLAALPSVEGVEGFRLTTDIDRVVTQDERRFLQAVSGLSAAPVPSAPSLDQALDALARISNGPAFVVAIMDGEVNPRRTQVAVSRLLDMGHDVAVVVPATGPHHCTKEDAPVDDLREAMERRLHLAHVLAVQKVPMVVLHPGKEDAVVKEVARFAV